MIIVVVTFKIPSNLDMNSLEQKFLETAPIYKETPGLVRKNNIADIVNNTAGGIYCFKTLQNAKDWFNEERIAWITSRYSKPTIKFFDNPVIVDNDKNIIIS